MGQARRLAGSQARRFAGSQARLLQGWTDKQASPSTGAMAARELCCRFPCCRLRTWSKARRGLASSARHRTGTRPPIYCLLCPPSPSPSPSRPPTPVRRQPEACLAPMRPAARALPPAPASAPRAACDLGLPIAPRGLLPQDTRNGLVTVRWPMQDARCSRVRVRVRVGPCRDHRLSNLGMLGTARHFRDFILHRAVSRLSFPHHVK
jgi:hypothetical protein